MYNDVVSSPSILLGNPASPAGHKTPDDVLIKRVAAGNRLAMHLLFARHHARVYRFILRWVGDATVAEDCHQRGFSERVATGAPVQGALQRLDLVAGDRPQQGDRRAAAAGAAKRWARRSPAIEDPRTIPRSALQAKDRSQAMRLCLTQLSPEHREMIDLVYYHEKSIEEIAEIVGIPKNTVKTRTFYARKRLADLLDTAGVAGLCSDMRPARHG